MRFMRVVYPISGLEWIKGKRPPKGYAVAAQRINADCTIYAPFGLHWIVRAWAKWGGKGI